MSAPPTIAELNDAFRSRLGIPVFGETVPGKFVWTQGIDALSPEAQIDIWQTVRMFADFTEDIDPHREHDFGAFDHPEAGKVFWKIDYYADNTCQFGSGHPEDMRKSFRVLTMMLAEEY